MKRCLHIKAKENYDLYVHVIIIINNTGVKQHVKKAFMNENSFY